MQRSSNRVAMGVNVAVKAATIALLLVALASPDLPQFQGKAFTGRAIAYHEGETINERALLAMFRAIIANNRAGGWRRIQRDGGSAKG